MLSTSAWYFSSFLISLSETNMMKNVNSSDIISPKVTTHSGMPPALSCSGSAMAGLTWCQWAAAQPPAARYHRNRSNTYARPTPGQALAGPNISYAASCSALGRLFLLLAHLRRNERPQFLRNHPGIIARLNTDHAPQGDLHGDHFLLVEKAQLFGKRQAQQVREN